ITRAGFDDNVEVCVRYLAAWLAGTGCVPIHHLMEDAATAEIARAQLWQWLNHPRHGLGPLELDDGTPIDFHLLESALLSLPYRLHGEHIPGADRVAEAIGLLDRLCHAEALPYSQTVHADVRLGCTLPEDPDMTALPTADQLRHDWNTTPRWAGITRPYPAEEVVRLRGTVAIEYSLA